MANENFSVPNINLDDIKPIALGEVTNTSIPVVKPEEEQNKTVDLGQYAANLNTNTNASVPVQAPTPTPTPVSAPVSAPTPPTPVAPTPTHAPSATAPVSQQEPQQQVQQNNVNQSINKLLPTPRIGLFAAYGKFWARYANFSGLASIAEYWKAWFLNTLLTLVFFTISYLSLLNDIKNQAVNIGNDYMQNGGYPSPTPNLMDSITSQLGTFSLANLSALTITFVVITIVYVILTIIPTLAITTRRLHDSNKSGAIILAALSGIGIFVLQVFLMQNSNHKDNFYLPQGKENK